MQIRHRFPALAATAALALGISACEGASPLPVESDVVAERSVHATTAQDQLLKSVRQATARYNSTTQAARAGYAQHGPCIAIDIGAMGFHYMNTALVDATFDPREPEVLLYAPGPGGNLQLKGVEYVVLNEGQDWPHFGDQPFDEGGTPDERPHWSLHVWLYEHNPLGMFEPFNPNVSCPN